MINNQRILQLLETMLDSGSTPEAACADCPELLTALKDRWKQYKGFEAEVDAMFPASVPGVTDRTTATSRLNDPHAIPGYEILGLLGHGGMGVVYRARHLKLNRTVALKMLLSGVYASPAEVTRFSREAKLIAGLQHPHLVQVHDVGESGGCPYFTMELVEGGSLAQLLGGVPQPPSHAAKMVAKLAQAVQAAHDGGIVHRDLKPSNILLTGEGVPKISDFGLARRLEEDADLTLSGARIGTPSYMAPEQITNRTGEVGPLSDIYSLGAILYEMLTGRPPFRADTTADTERQLISDDPVKPSRLNSKVPRDLETICLKCLQKRANHRYENAKFLAEDLHRFLNGEPILARPAGPVRRAVKWAVRRPAHAMLAATALLAASVCISGSVWHISTNHARTRVVQADIEQAMDLERHGQWDQARNAYQRAGLELGNHGPASLRQHLDTGNRELDLVARLDNIDLSLATVAGTMGQNEIETAYCESFKDAGVELFSPDLSGVAFHISTSPIRIALVSAMNNWAQVIVDDRKRYWLLEVGLFSGDSQSPWQLRLRDPQLWDDKDALAKVASEASIDREQLSTLVLVGRFLEGRGIPFLVKVQQQHPTDFWVNLGLGDAEFKADKFTEAVRYLQVAVALRPSAAIAEENLGFALRRAGSEDEARVHFQNAIRLASGNPAITPLALAVYNAGAHAKLYEEQRQATSNPSQPTRRGNFELLAELGGAPQRVRDQYSMALGVPAWTQLETHWEKWKTTLDANPPDFNSWNGYAELSLYLHHDDEYRRARARLLEHFSDTADPHIAERIGRACLLRPASDEETTKAVALIDRALNADIAPAEGSPHAELQVAKALADFRQGHLQEANDILRGPASKALGPMPQLILAMIELQQGNAKAARKRLADAMQSYNWNPSHATDANAWMFYALRSELEDLLYPSAPATRPLSR